MRIKYKRKKDLKYDRCFNPSFKKSVQLSDKQPNFTNA